MFFIDRYLFISLLISLISFSLFAEDRMIHVKESPLSEKSSINFDASYYNSIYSSHLNKKDLSLLKEKILNLKTPKCKGKEDKDCLSIRAVGKEKKRIAVNLINRILLKMNSNESVLFYNVNDSYITSIILDNPESDVIYTSAGFHGFLDQLKKSVAKGDSEIWKCLLDNKILN